MKKLLFLVLLCFLAFLTGCATGGDPVWVKSGATQNDFHMDSGQCKAQAFSATTNLLQVGIIYNTCMQGKGWYLTEAEDSKAKGSHCVRVDAKVGDIVGYGNNGSQGVIKSLSGTSTRCTDPRFPILAVVEIFSEVEY
jgi:hypothetical protein